MHEAHFCSFSVVDYNDLSAAVIVALLSAVTRGIQKVCSPTYGHKRVK